MNRLRLFLRLGLLVACSGTFQARAVEALEHEIKATFLYNFAKFTDWTEVKADTGKVLTICILGEDSFKANLESLIRGKTIKSRPVEVRQLKSLEPIQECRVLFVSGAENKNFLKNRKSLPAQNLLTVGEDSDFIAGGGQIQFFLEEDKVKFEIDLPAVEKSGMKIDARVLNIAKIRREK